MSLQKQLSELTQYFADDDLRLSAIITKIKFILQTYNYYDKNFTEDESTFQEIKEMLDHAIIDIQILLSLGSTPPNDLAFRDRVKQLHSKNIIHGITYIEAEERLISD